MEYGKDTLLPGIRSRRVDNNNGVTMHALEAGFEVPGRPCVLLLHGFPELAYTWRKQLLPLAAAGYHVIAPDLRGYRRSTSAPVRFDDDLLPYTWLNRVSDVLGLVRALGFEQVAAVVGHDWGGPTAAWCALIRPDVFQSVVQKGPLTINDVETCIRSTLRGAGLFCLPRSLVMHYIQQGQMETVLDSHSVEVPGLALYYPSRSQSLPKLRAFIELATMRMRRDFQAGDYLASPIS